MEHAFNIEVAEEYGVPAAILIRHFQYWIIKNKANGRNQHEGRTWTYNSVQALKNVFPYWSTRQVRVAVDGLLKSGVLMKGNFNKQPYDRTTWYAFADEQAFVTSDKWNCQNGQLDRSVAANGFAVADQPIPNPKPITEPSKNTNRGLNLSPESMLALDLRIVERARFLAEEIQRILHPARREARTFRNIIAHLIERAQQDPRKIADFTYAVQWAKEAAEARVANHKGLFVSKVKQQTGFKAQRCVLAGAHKT